MGLRKMKAVIASRYGGPDVLVLKEVDLPQPNENEFLVKIQATSVTAAHCAMRSGTPYFGRLFIGLTKPKVPIPGTDLSGEVVAVGKNVKAFKVGDELIAATDLKGSCYAEYISLTEQDVALPKPGNMTHSEATSILDGATTALAFLRNVAELKPAQHILINGASGGIGTFAVQLAKFFGAKVTGVCSTKNLDLVKSLGADEVIDYTESDFTRNLKQYDVIFDTVGKTTFPKCKASLVNGGLYMTPVLTLSVLGQMIWTSLVGNRKAKFTATGLRKPEEKIRDLKYLVKLIEAGELKTIIDREYRLDQIIEAHRYVETGHKIGNVVVRLV